MKVDHRGGADGFAIHEGRELRLSPFAFCLIDSQKRPGEQPGLFVVSCWENYWAGDGVAAGWLPLLTGDSPGTTGAAERSPVAASCRLMP